MENQTVFKDNIRKFETIEWRQVHIVQADQLAICKRRRWVELEAAWRKNCPASGQATRSFPDWGHLVKPPPWDEKVDVCKGNVS